MPRDGETAAVRWPRNAPCLDRTKAQHDGQREGEQGSDLYALQCVREVRDKINRTELATVRQAREARVSWTEIATSLGVSRQAAWERWHDVDEDIALTH